MNEGRNDTILATVTALIPDQVPLHQRANTSVLNGMAPIFGGVVGLSVLFVLIFLSVLREQPHPREAVPLFRLKSFLTSFLHPLASRDFVYTLGSRLLVFLSFTMLGAFLLFYLQGVFHVSAAVAAHTLTTFQVISTLLLAVVALLTGYLAHRLNRLKPFVIIGALLMALGLGVLVVFPAV